MTSQGRTPQSLDKKRARSPIEKSATDSADSGRNKSRKSSRTQTPSTKHLAASTEEEADVSSEGPLPQLLAAKRQIKSAQKKPRGSIPTDISRLASATTSLRRLDIEDAADTIGDESMEMPGVTPRIRIEDYDLDDIFGDDEQVIIRKKVEKKADPKNDDWEHLAKDDPRIAEWSQKTFYWRQGATRNALSKAEAIARFAGEIKKGRDVRAMAVVGNRGEPLYEKDIIKNALEHAVEMANEKEVRCKVLVSGTEMARQPGKDRSPWLMVSYDNAVKSSILEDIRLSIHPNYDGKCVGVVWRKLETDRKAMYVGKSASSMPITDEAKEALRKATWVRESGFTLIDMRKTAVEARIEVTFSFDKGSQIEKSSSTMIWPSCQMYEPLTAGTAFPKPRSFNLVLPNFACSICHSDDHAKSPTQGTCPLQGFRHMGRPITWSAIPRGLAETASAAPEPSSSSSSSNLTKPTPIPIPTSSPRPVDK
jgi:hypothetical protein